MALFKTQHLVFSVVAMAICVHTLEAAEPNASKTPSRAKAKVTLGKETTFVSEPLRSDGYPDYLAALNQSMSAGVTPENNAAVLLQQVFGPGKIPKESREEYFRQLGIAPLPDEGNYFVSRDEMLNRWKAAHPSKGDAANDSLYEQFNEATERLWTEDEFPMVTEWLRLNETQLQKAVQAIQQPKCFFPLLPDGRFLMTCKLHYAQQSREIAAALAARAMLRAAEQHPSDAWQDLLNCHRLARHIDNGNMLVESLVAIAIDGVATQAELSLIHDSKLSANQLKEMQHELAALPPLRDAAESVAIGERFTCLDAMIYVAQHGLLSIRDLSAEADDQTPLDAGQVAVSDRNVDWEAVLKAGNQWFDRIEVASKIADRRSRRQAYLELRGELKAIAAAVKDSSDLLRDLISKSPREFISGKTSSILIALLLPANWAALQANDRQFVKEGMVQAAFALALYRAEHGSYPNRLEELAPKYLARVPDDLFKAEPGPIGYRREGGSYLIWTVHVDGVDDNGLTESGDIAGDDYVWHPIPRTKELRGEKK